MFKKSGGLAGADAGRRRIVTDAVAALAPAPGMTAAICASPGVSRATVYRKRPRLSAPPAIARSRPRPVRALNDPQRQQVLDVLRAPRFADQAPAEIYAALLDEGVCHCSIRTMCRILSPSYALADGLITGGHGANA